MDFLLAVVAVIAATAGAGLVAAVANALGFWRALKDIPPIFVPVGVVGAVFGVFLVLRGGGPTDVNSLVENVIGGFGTAVGLAVIAVLFFGVIGLGVGKLRRRSGDVTTDPPPDQAGHP